MGEAKRRKELLGDRYGTPNIDKKTLPTPQELLDELGDRGIYLLKEISKKQVTVFLAPYAIVEGKGGEHQLQVMADQKLITSLLKTDAKEKIISNPLRQAFRVKLSPQEESASSWGDKIIPFKLVEILG